MGDCCTVVAMGHLILCKELAALQEGRVSGELSICLSSPVRPSPSLNSPTRPHDDALGLLLRRNGEFDLSGKLENSPSIFWKQTTQHPGGSAAPPWAPPPAVSTGRQPQELHPQGTLMDRKRPPKLEQAEKAQLRVNRPEAGGAWCPI